MIRDLASIFALALTIGAAPALAAEAPAPATAAGAALQLDQALRAAVLKGDKAAAGRLLEPGFTWTDLHGVTRSKAATLDRLSALHPGGEAAEVVVHDYGKLATVTGDDHGIRFAHVLAKRPGGWREYLILETAVVPGGKASVEAAAGQGDCLNPCRTLPYTPKTAMDRAILQTWQETKLEEWHPDATRWATHIADEFLIINAMAVRNRSERVVIANRQQASGVGTPGDPISAMEMHDFGDNAAVMISHHTPYRGGKPYYNVRVWVLRDARWQLALSQQSTIEAAAPVPAVAATK